MKKVSWIRFLKFISLLFLMLMLNRSMLFRKIRPFGVASAFALLLCGISPFSVILTYGISSLIFRLSLEGIISIVTECCVMILIIMIQKAIKKKLPTYIYCTLLLISQSAKLYFSFGYIETILSGLASIFVSFISFFIFLISFNSIRKRGKLFKFTIDEKVCHSFLIVTCFSGLEGLYIYNFLLTNVISIMVLFLVSRIFPSSFTIVLSTLSGLGLSLASLSVVPLAMFSIWATMMITFKNNSKIIAGLMVMASDVVMGVFLNTYGVYDLWVMLSTFSGLFVVCLFSDKKLLNCHFW